MVTASGEVLRLSRERDGETFRGAVVGLGALGVITAVTLEIQPTFTMRQYVYENLPLSALKDHFDAIESSAYSVSLFTDWQKQRINEVWMSPCYEQPSVTIHFTWKPDWPAVSKLLPIIENELAPFHPRPHWGKLFTMPPASLKNAYPRTPEFLALCNKYDPRGKFRNEFL